MSSGYLAPAYLRQGDNRLTNKLEDALLDVIVTRLEARGKHRFFQNVL